MATGNSKPASVTLRDLADDLDYHANQAGVVLEWLNHRQLDDTGLTKVVEGLHALVEVIRGYSEAGFRIES